MSDPFDSLDEATLQIIGDDIIYIGVGAPEPDIKAWAEHAPAQIDFASSGAATASQASIQVRKADVFHVSKEDRITLPRTGLTYRPLNWGHSRCGRLWDIGLTKVVA